ncbi:hypothetical protein BH24ACT20_BH24ACT20_12530 [soil metagenome]
MSAKSEYPDTPKSLHKSNVNIRREREDLLHQRLPHIEELFDFVNSLRTQRAREHPINFEEKNIPHFDPLDGGIAAKCLFLFEAPGRGAVNSGFVSRNNPDESAKTFFELNEKAELDRCLTVSWNVVPWYLGDGKRIRAARAKDIREGLEHLWSLLELLKNIQVVVLGGRKSQRAKSDIQDKRPDICVTDMWHPSPQSLNRVPKRRKEILETLHEVSRGIS